MFGPGNPVRFFVSSNLRKVFRSFSNTFSTSFAKNISADKLEYEIFSHSLPILRDLNGVKKELFLNKRKNLMLAMEKVNGVLIHPKEKFSFWKLVGNPKSSRGYLPGLTLSCGKPSESIGGGLCQFSNMIFFLSLHSDLNVVERHHHSFDIFPDSDRKVPFGTGATLVYNYKDLCLFNPTDRIYQLIFDIDENNFYGKLLASEKEVFTYRIFEDSEKFVKKEEKYYRENIIYRERTAIENGRIETELLFKNRRLCMYKPTEI